MEFPSDALSVKRLRYLFPDRFEAGTLTDGYGDFFYPAGPGDPEHLVRLQELLSAERTLAAYAFYDATDPYPSETLDDECRWCADQSKAALVQLYQDFRLADSPEAARALVRHVEEQAAHQGAGTQGRTR